MDTGMDMIMGRGMDMDMVMGTMAKKVMVTQDMVLLERNLKKKPKPTKIRLILIKSYGFCMRVSY
jgi:hypothetical protein